MDPISIGQRLFTPEALQQAIEQTATLAPDKKGAFIGTLDANGAHALLRVRLSDHVEFEGAADWNPVTNDVKAGAKVIASW